MCPIGRVRALCLSKEYSSKSGHVVRKSPHPACRPPSPTRAAREKGNEGENLTILILALAIEDEAALDGALAEFFPEAVDGMLCLGAGRGALVERGFVT